MPPHITSPAGVHSRHPFTTAVAGRAGRPKSNLARVPDVPVSPPPGLTETALVAAEARLADALRRGEVGDDGPADVAALGLTANR